MKVHLFLMFFLALINVIIPDKSIDRRKVILPFSFIIIAIYWCIRYDYGLDYWSYYDSFYSNVTEKDTGTFERLFFMFMNSFKYFYQFVIAESLVVVFSLYHIVRKYLPTNCYWLFFLLLFAVPSLHFNLISAMRSTMAACVLYWAFDLFYISKRNWPLFFLCVIVASMFHTSALSFVFFPIVCLLFTKLKGIQILVILLVTSVMRMFVPAEVYNWVVSLTSVTQSYDFYAERINVSNINGFIVGLVELVPAFFICRSYDKLKDNVMDRKIILVACYYLLITTIGLNFHGRFSAYLFPFFIVALSIPYNQIGKNERWYMLLPYFAVVAYHMVDYYRTALLLSTSVWSEGNPCFYHTLFESPIFPF